MAFSDLTLRNRSSPTTRTSQKNIRLMQTTLLFLNLGGQEIFLILIVVLLLFGGQKIPELMRGLGKGISEFNKAKNSVEDEIRNGIRDADQAKKP